MKSRRTVKRSPISNRDTGSAFPQLIVPVPLRSDQFELALCFCRKLLAVHPLVEEALEGVRGVQLSGIIPGATAEDGQIFHQTFLSFSLLVFGTQHRQHQMVNRGYVIYGETLRRLNRVISDPDYCARDEVYLAVNTLALLEVLVPTGPRHYMKHMIALERLLTFRGTNLPFSARSSVLYEGTRHMVVFASLRTGRPSILAREEWKSTMRALCTETRITGAGLTRCLSTLYGPHRRP